MVIIVKVTGGGGGGVGLKWVITVLSPIGVEGEAGKGSRKKS